MPSHAGQDPGSLVQQAVEDFVDRCTAGENPDPRTFADTWPEPVREQVYQRCRRFLEFDDLVGKQQWSEQELQTPAGRVFGDFVIQEELGRGGMGVVYLAHQRSLNRRVAVKVMASGLSLSRRHVERFRREATQAARLQHPGIVPVHSFTEVDGTFAFAMDYIAGRNLGEVLDDLRLANGDRPGQIEGTLGLQPDKGYVAECALLCAQIAGALAAAHRTGIAHRDIKPRNIMIDEHRRALLLDFGLAKSVGHASISQSGELTGTAHYMSPEQTLAKRAPQDHRTDIFSLGVILYEMLTLRRPFDGKNLQQVVYELCFVDPVPIPRRNARVPRDLITICNKALEKDPQKRYQTADEFEADLLRFLRWEPIHARPAGPLTRALKWTQRHRTETAVLGILLLAALVLGSVRWLQDLEAQRLSDQLLHSAQQSADRGDYEAAIAQATEALKVLPTNRVETTLALLRKESELLATREQRLAAEANLLLARSSASLEVDRELALHAALLAVDRRDTPEARNAVLDALGSGYRTTTFASGQSPLRSRLSPDASLVATTHYEGEAVLWDAKTGSERLRLRGRGPALDVTFHPTAAQVATADVQSTATIWSTITGAEQRAFSLAERLQALGHPGVDKCTVEHVRFADDGRRLLTTAWVDYLAGPFLAQVWDVETGEALGAMAGHGRYIEVAAISRDGRFVASYGDEGIVRLWDAATGAQLAELAHRGRVRAIAFAADGQLVATASSDGHARVFAVPDGTPLRLVRHTRDVTSVQFDRAGRRLLTASRDFTARLWDLGLGSAAGSAAGGAAGGPTAVEAGFPRGPAAPRLCTELRTFLGHRRNVTMAAFDRTEELVVTACEDAVTRVFDIGSGDLLMRYEVGGPVESAQFDRDSSSILNHAGMRRAVLWHLDETRGTVNLRHPSHVGSACFVPDVGHAVTACDDEAVRVWDSRTGKRIRELRGLGDPVQAIAVDPKSNRLLLGTLSGRVAVYQLYGDQVLLEPAAHPGAVHTAVFALDGETLMTCSEDGLAVVRNARDGDERWRVQLPDGQRATAAALSAHGTHLAIAPAAGPDVLLYRVGDAAPPVTIGGHTAPVRALAFAPDGRRLVTASQDGTARLSALDGGEIRVFDAGAPLTVVAMSPDGDRLLTATPDGGHDAHLWDVDSGVMLLRFQGHDREITGAAFHPAGQWAITCGKDRTARIWPTDPVALARSLALRPLQPHERQLLGLPADSAAAEPDTPR